VREQAEEVLNQTELKEFQTRIAILSRELDDKNKEIEQISIERKKVEETIDRTMDLEVDLKDQTDEIDVLNSRYRKALKDKVSTYEELLNAVKMLAERNSTYMNNEIEIAKLTNLTSISKKELEQKEKIHQELKESIDNHDEAAKLAASSDVQIASKQQKVEELSNDLYEKDKMIEQLKTLLSVR
jgi:predicted RNase H-like nuclease (RuvC/YqgF family)